MPRTPSSHLSPAPKLAVVSTSVAPTVAVGDRYWMYVLVRAIPAAFIALFITFNADHSVQIGWVTLVAFAALTGNIIAIGATKSLVGEPQRLQIIQGLVLVVGGVVGLFASAGGLVVLTIVLSAVFVVSGALELVAGIRSRGMAAAARDWIFLGAASVVFGLAVLLIPTDLSQEITIPGKEVPNLTASVVVVGALGAYAAIVTVYLVIAGLSLKWAKHPEAVAGVKENP